MDAELATHIVRIATEHHHQHRQIRSVVLAGPPYQSMNLTPVPRQQDAPPVPTAVTMPPVGRTLVMTRLPVSSAVKNKLRSDSQRMAKHQNWVHISSSEDPRFAKITKTNHRSTCVYGTLSGNRCRP